MGLNFDPHLFFEGRKMADKIIKAITVRQPWATAIIECGKDIENRSWRTHFRGRVFIHAGRLDKEGILYFKENYPRKKLPEELPCGAIIGSVEIVDCVDSSKSKWFEGEYGFVLKNPVRIDPIPVKGRLGFWNVPEAVIKKISKSKKKKISKISKPKLGKTTQKSRTKIKSKGLGTKRGN